LKKTTPISVPQWLYNYTPNKNDVVPKPSQDSVNEFSVVASVQQKLGTDTTGFLDSKTKIAINKYRTSKGMLVNGSIDADLLYELGLESSVLFAIKEIDLYDSPTKDRVIYRVPVNSKLLVLNTVGNMKQVKVVGNGKLGFVNSSEVTE
jgi:hypothetical protein